MEHPTVVLMYNKQVYPYDGQLTAKKVKTWIEEDYEYQSVKIKIPPALSIGK